MYIQTKSSLQRNNIYRSTNQKYSKKICRRFDWITRVININEQTYKLGPKPLRTTKNTNTINKHKPNTVLGRKPKSILYSDQAGRVC